MALTQVQTGMLGTGAVLQVVNATYSTQVSNATTTYATTGLTATITPKFATSKILVLVSQNGVSKSGDTSVKLKLTRTVSAISTDILQIAAALGETGSTLTQYTSASASILDSPATTSAVTYNTQFAARIVSTTVITQATVSGVTSDSTITLMEIAG